MNRLGIIGGLGPMATATFLKRIIQMTDAARDQEHIDCLIAHCPSIPDRTRFLLDPTAPDPAAPMVEAGRMLAEMGAAAIAIPCVTAHGFHSRLSEAIPVPIYNGVDLAAGYLADRGIRRVGVMATDGTVGTGILEKGLVRRGIETVYPDAEGQRGVMDLIYRDVKAGLPADRELFRRVSGGLFHRGAELVLLGCTELSVAAEDWLPPGRYLDILDVLAGRCVEDFGKLKPAYRELIKGEDVR